MNVFGHIELDALRADEFAIRKELELAGAKFKGRACLCIFHDERNPSAGIYLDDGVWRYKCHGCGVGGDIIDIRAMLNKSTVDDELRKMKAPSQNVVRAIPSKIFVSLEAVAGQLTNVEAIYRYTNPTSNEVDLAVIRWRDAAGKKKFIQCRPVGGGWLMKGLDSKNPIYNRARVAKSDLVIVVEGEKCVHSLHEAGFVATTSPAGAMNGLKADWTPLAGKNVVLWPDNDAPDEKYPHGKGVAHMREVQKLLEQLTPSPYLSWLDPTKLGLDVKGDAADVIAKYQAQEDKRLVIQALLDEAEPMGISRELRDRFEETIAGKRRSVSFGRFDSLSYWSRALVPGSVTCVCGDPGSTKSLWLLQLAAEWHQNGVKACIYELEDDRAYHMQRCIAQMDGNADLTDSEWIEINPEASRDAMARHAQFFDSFGRTLWESPDEMVTLEMLKEWVRARAESGYEVIVIDPVTAAEAEDKPWIADLEFIMSVKTTARRYGCRIILVTHPKKGGKTPTFGLDGLAGGAAYQRFSHTVLWLVNHTPPVDVRVKQYRAGDCFAQINRSIRIIKARNGRGPGLAIGINFDPKTLISTEAGVVVSKIGESASVQEEAEGYATKHGI